MTWHSYQFFLFNAMFQFTPLPVWHGRGYRSLGFRFGNVCYIRYGSILQTQVSDNCYSCTLISYVMFHHRANCLHSQ